MKHTLIWKNKKAEDMGLKIISLPPIQVSTERLEEIEILEKDGTLNLLNGFTSDEKTVEADYRGNNPRMIAEWLSGEGEVIFGNEEDRYYKARINNVVPLSQVIESYLYNLPIKFKCQPHAYLLEGRYPIDIINGAELYNGKSTYDSKPIITIYGTGSCTLKINNKEFVITQIPNGYITIDSEIEECYNSKGNVGEYFEPDIFPILEADEKYRAKVNKISWTGAGVTKVTIIPYWRTL